MQLVARHFVIATGSRALAAFLLLALMLNPSCSSVCQAQSCQNSQSTRKDSTCHHDADAAVRHFASVSASSANCGARDLLPALPEPSSNWRVNEAAQHSIASEGFSRLNTIASGASCAGFLKPDLDYLAEFRRSVASQFSFDSFVFLRV
jgi:hypothetical protein